jgi:hypothetical protein
MNRGGERWMYFAVGFSAISGALLPYEAFVGEDTRQPSAFQSTNTPALCFTPRLTGEALEVELALI